MCCVLLLPAPLNRVCVCQCRFICCVEHDLTGAFPSCESSINSPSTITMLVPWQHTHTQGNYGLTNLSIPELATVAGDVNFDVTPAHPLSC